MADYIEENSEFLIEEDSGNYSYFIRLSVKNKNLICKDIVNDAPFETISEFRASFDSAVREYKKSDSSKNSSGGTGGGSGRKTTSRTSVSVVPDVQIQSPEEETPLPTPEIQETPSVFNDLVGFEWAKDDIDFLYSKGIISDSEDKCYRPQDSIKREEIVKMIVEAFVKNKSTSGHLFADSEDGAWYNPYLDTAYENGIVLGRPDGSFGVGENISREDMAVMIYRALSALGLNPEKGDALTFSDSRDISAYALDAVSSFVYSGVINGMGDGTFAPKGNATRAQVAKLISNILKTYEGSLAE